MKLEKIEKILSREEIKHINDLDDIELHKLVIDSEENIAEATQARDDNLKYQEIKEAKADFDGALSDVNKRQKAKIALVLNILRERA